MDIFNKEKIADLELEIEALTSQCEILRCGNTRLRGEVQKLRQNELYSLQHSRDVIGGGNPFGSARGIFGGGFE